MALTGTYRLWSMYFVRAEAFVSELVPPDQHELSEPAEQLSLLLCLRGRGGLANVISAPAGPILHDMSSLTSPVLINYTCPLHPSPFSNLGGRQAKEGKREYIKRSSVDNSDGGREGKDMQEKRCVSWETDGEKTGQYVMREPENLLGENKQGRKEIWGGVGGVLHYTYTVSRKKKKKNKGTVKDPYFKHVLSSPPRSRHPVPKCFTAQ